MENTEFPKSSGKPSGSKKRASPEDISRATSVSGTSESESTRTRFQVKLEDQTYDFSEMKSKMDSEAQTSHVKIYRPYDIEEPDDDTIPGIQGLEIPSLPDYFERWQRDFVDDIDGTQSDPSDYATRQLRVDPTRGQKRKPTNSAGLERGSASQWQCSRPGTRPRDEAVSGQYRPAHKRRRRRSRLGNDSVKAAPVQSLYEFRDTQLNESSSSDYWSTETDGSADSMQDSAITDDMDID